MAEIEIGLGKSGRRAYGFDDIAIVPSRRTRDPEDVDISWQIVAFRMCGGIPAFGNFSIVGGERDAHRPEDRGGNGEN